MLKPRGCIKATHKVLGSLAYIVHSTLLYSQSNFLALCIPLTTLPALDSEVLGWGKIVPNIGAMRTAAALAAFNSQMVDRAFSICATLSNSS